MKNLQDFTVRLIAGANIATIVCMLLIGFSDRINPVSHPLLANIGLFFPVFLAINVGFLFFWLVVRKRMVIIPVVGLILAFVPVRTYTPLNMPEEAPKGSLKVMSYNVFNFSTWTSPDEPCPILDYVEAQRPDILCFQEFSSGGWKKERVMERLGKLYSYHRISDRVLPEITAWKSRMLDPVYAICWLDAIHYKVKDDKGRAVTRAIYNVLGINKSGHKDLLGMYISESEGANFWLDVMTDLQNRGVRDILICCVDGLKGFPDAIQSVFPETSVQLCVVHQIRNSIKYVGSKHQKEFLKDLKTVYGAVSKDSALAQLDMVDEKWGEMYPIVIKSWRDNWERLTEYFQYTPAIRKLIYTTNTVEGYHRQVRKVTKNKGVFPSDTALEKLVYLAYRDISGKWTMPLSNWALISQQLAIKFGDRFKIM